MLAPETPVGTLTAPPLASAPHVTTTPTTTVVLPADAAPAPRMISPALAMLAGHWRVWLACLWLAGLLTLLPRTWQQWRLARRLLRESQPLHEPALLQLCRQHAQALGLRHDPALRLSHAISSPQVIGLRQADGAAAGRSCDVAR